MKIYLVGGAVRNKLLNLPIYEKDWLVVGSSVKEMIKLGYFQVGKNFPVFIHPVTKEEYALARTEIKTGVGYKEFNFLFSNKTTIKEDLYRRDITINAIAIDDKGKIIDPYNGLYDIKNKIIRHVSNKFKEDPLRVLRVARFYSYLYYLNFIINFKTFKLITIMSINGELNFLSKDRIWKEIKKNFVNSIYPQHFFKVLYLCKALEKISLELKNIFNFIFKNLNYLNNKNIFLKIIHFKYYKIKILFFFYNLYLIYYLNKININNIKINIKNFIKNFNLEKNIKKYINNLHIYLYLDIYLEKFNIFNIIKILNKLNLNNILKIKYYLNFSSIYNDKRMLYYDNNFNFYNKKDILYIIFFLKQKINIKNIINNKIFIIEYKKELINKQYKYIYYNIKNILKIKKL